MATTNGTRAEPGRGARARSGREPALAGHRAARTRPTTSSASAAASCPSTRWRGSARSASGSCSASDAYVPALGAITGGQAVQMVRAGLQAIYLSGWQVAADANLAGQTYPDQSLYPANSVPALVRRLNNALLRADQIDCAGGPRRDRTGSRRSSPTRRRASAGR